MAVAGIFLGTVLVKQLYEKRCGRPPRPPYKVGESGPEMLPNRADCQRQVNIVALLTRVITLALWPLTP